MANYTCTQSTNYFRVTDEKRFRELMSCLVAEDEIHVLSRISEDGTVFHRFGSYSNIECLPDGDEDADYSIDWFLKEIQKILPEKEAFMLFEVGNEKLRYVYGSALVVTRDNIASMEITDWAQMKAQELLGDDFHTEVD